VRQDETARADLQLLNGNQIQIEYASRPAAAATSTEIFLYLFAT